MATSMLEKTIEKVGIAGRNSEGSPAVLLRRAC